jgi:hypothetical protein
MTRFPADLLVCRDNLSAFQRAWIQHSVAASALWEEGKTWPSSGCEKAAETPLIVLSSQWPGRGAPYPVSVGTFFVEWSLRSFARSGYVFCSFLDSWYILCSHPSSAKTTKYSQNPRSCPLICKVLSLNVQKALSMHITSLVCGPKYNMLSFLTQEKINNPASYGHNHQIWNLVQGILWP